MRVLHADVLSQVVHHRRGVLTIVALEVALGMEVEAVSLQGVLVTERSPTVLEQIASEKVIACGKVLCHILCELGTGL